MPTDPYEVLGVARSATAAKIKQAYRKLARKHHPDLHPDDANAEARFKTMSAAHDLLKDPTTRARFDAGEIDADGVERPTRQYTGPFAEGSGTAQRQAGGFGSSFGEGFDPSDIFAEVLRQRGRGAGFSDQSYPSRGSDLRFALEVPFLDAARGSEIRLTLGEGTDIAIRIPAAARDGQILRLRGKGSPGTGGGPPGDALIALTILPHPVFRREGDDILVTLPITIDEAILGGKVSTPTITGPVSLTILSGTSSGRLLRLRGRGLAKAVGKGVGDQLVDLRIVVPKEIDPELRDFLTNWRIGHHHDIRAEFLKEAAP
ncbi:J domain-containing protein [Tabrizicola piscis]|uniref:J domain-containing protein n=1 Tax=Tabrizicola piscis TaxID=2494374 RepID=A0A3S8U7G7_9RHOB|nr:DnaJ C-terminal domain-containing protein [Tabrizicola piscis]AZL59551.1 J domain-containing protein [Tabrizicola piscis]